MVDFPLARNRARAASLAAIAFLVGAGMILDDLRPTWCYSAPIRKMQSTIFNDRLQPLDADGKIIPGLYLAGNTVGGRCKQAYPLLGPGISHSMAMTTGYLAGRFALGLT